MLSTNRIEVSTTSTDSYQTLSQPILLKKRPGKTYQIAFLELTTPYSWQNITTEDNNTILKYDNGVDPQETITFNDGIWTIDAINEFIFDFCQVAGDTYLVLGEELSPIRFEVDATRGILSMFIYTAFTVDFGTGDLYDLLGYVATTYTAGTHLGSTMDITNHQARCLVELSLVSNSFFNSGSSNVIYSFAPDERPYATMVEKPLVPLYLPLDVSYISSFRLSLVGTDKRPIRNAGEQINVVFHLIEVDNPDQ